MDVDEFEKRVRPAKKKSKLAPWLSAIHRLRGDDYTLDQVLEFLEQNDVHISQSGLSSYLRRQASKAKEQPASPAAQPPRRQPPAESEPSKERELEAAPVVGSHNPADLNKIISDKPDLAALAKLATKRKPSK